MRIGGLCSGIGGLELGLDRVAHGIPSRLVRDPLHALGNAVVPAVAETVGTWLLERITAEVAA